MECLQYIPLPGELLLATGRYLCDLETRSYHVLFFFLLSVNFLKMQDSFAGCQDKVMHQVTWDVVSGWVKLQNFLETAAGMGKKQRA